MAEAGFYHCPTEREPDLVKCFVCLKELDGWEPDDDPWLEHQRHSGKCPYLQYCNPDEPKKMTVKNFLKLEQDRQRLLVNKEFAHLEKEMQKFAMDARQQMKSLVAD